MSPQLSTINIPNSYKRYICVGELNNPQVGITVTHNTIMIINHKYYYSIEISRSLYLKMIDLFDRKITKERNIMEKAIYDNITQGLSNII
jgi:hypothetical protein